MKEEGRRGIGRFRGELHVRQLKVRRERRVRGEQESRREADGGG
jgi:hypothetical protein